MAESFQSFEQYLHMFHRRRGLIALVGGSLFLVAVAVAFLWPPTYRSMATILIIEQEVPADLVRSTVTGYADQQIERIKAQVMTRSRLLPIIEEYNLYKDLRERNTSAQALQQFVKDIAIEVMSADVVDRRTGRATQATIAFTLAYEGRMPVITQKIANELTTLFLNENLKNREEQVQETTAFLMQETEKLAGGLAELEGQIAKFKKQAKGALPELFQMNMQFLSQLERELIEKNQQAQVQEERIGYLEGELARYEQERPLAESLPSLREQLKTLRYQYASMASHLSPAHPDIIKLKGEIEALEGQLDGPIRKDELSETLKEEEMKLASLLERYGPEHPDVVRARSTVALLKKDVEAGDPSSSISEEEASYDLSYLTLKTQLASAKTTLAHLRRNQEKLSRQAHDYAMRIERTPELEPRYHTLVRSRESAAQKLQEYRSRLLEAQVAEGLELERKGERFSLVDPPSLPEAPVRPNRVALLVLGLVLALAGGVGGGAVAEAVDGSIYTVERLAAVIGMAPLSAIPFVVTPQQERARTRRRVMIIIGVIALMTMALFVIHVFWWPLDVAWYVMLRKLQLE